jgi:hypothetical protein
VDGPNVALETSTPLEVQPAADEVWEAGAPFSWSARPSGVFQLRDRDAVGATVPVVYTQKTSVTFPAGFTPGAGTHQWRVAYFPRATPDSFAGTLYRGLLGRTLIDPRALVVP